MKNSILITALFWLIINTPLFASIYTVTGGGTTNVNGNYVETNRTINGKPVYEKGEFRLGYRNCSARWVIVDGNDDDNIEDGYCPLYLNYNNTSDVPLSDWEVGIEGTSPAPTVTQYSGLYYNSEIYTESNNNDGTIDNYITITYEASGTDYFTGTNDIFSSAKYSSNNIPAGLTLQITKLSNTELKVELLGTASNSTNASDITNLEISFNDNAFNNGDAAAVAESTNSDLEVNFIDEYTVASSGGDYTSIAEAISSVDCGDILNLAAETFTESGLVIDKNLTIQGQSSSSTIIQGHATQGSASDRVFTINTGLTVIISNVTIKNGNTTTGEGGGIYFEGENIQITNSIISNNISAYYGGGLSNASYGTMTIENSTIINNTSTESWSRGGGIYSEHGILIISNSTITGNQCSGSSTKGGGISGKGTITNTTITNNSCSENGGALFTYGVTLNNCTVKDNSTGMYYYMGTLTVSNSIIVDNGSYDYNGESSSLTDNGYNIVENSSIAANEAGGFNNVNTILYNTKYDESGTSFSSWTQGGTELSNQNLNLSSTLADNNTIFGTQTLALSSGSFAIDNGTGSADDQRGVPVFNSTKDIGAYEYTTNWCTWQGATSSDWNTASNWSPAAVPGSSANIGIELNCCNNLSVAVSTTCNTLNIPENASMTIEDNGAVTVSSELSNEGTITIQSNAEGTGSLIIEGDIENTGTMTAQRYISGNSNDWHLISSPVSSQCVSGNFTDNLGYDFYLYYEAQNLWVNQKNTTTSPTFYEANGSYNFIPGCGYLVAYTDQNTNAKSFNGTFNQGTVSVALTKTGEDTYSGSNLIGNPYPSSIDWKASTGWTRNMLASDEGGYTMYIWNESQNNYGTFISNGSAGTNGATQYISPMQGFFVVAASTGTLQMTEDICVHNQASWLKQSNSNEKIISIKVTNSIYGTDEIIIEKTQEINCGARKWFSINETAPSLWIETNNKHYSILLFNNENIADEYIIGFSAGADGEYTLNTNFDHSAFTSLTLEDRKLDYFQNLVESDTYTFTGSINDNTERFVLHINATGLEETSHKNIIRIWPEESTLHIYNPEAKSGQIQIFNMFGQQILTTKLDNKIDQKHIINVSSGHYIVNISGNDFSVNKKVFFK